MFEFATATQIIFGRGSVSMLAQHLLQHGRRALLVLGGHPERWDAIESSLVDAQIDVTLFSVAKEPSTLLAQAGVEQARREQCDVVVAVGGGSVIDAGKAMAALLGNPGEILDYLEVVGSGRPLERPGLPFVAVPTTSGTGAEVTKNAVLQSTEHGVKVSLRSPFMLPRLALLDPALTDSVPPAVTAATGLDALTQCLEPYLSCKANPLTDSIAAEGMRRGARSLWRAYQDGRDADARDDMALASLCGGLALANAKLGAVHGFAAPLGGMFAAPHGAVCARLLPEVMGANLRALRLRQPQSPVLARFQQVAALLTADPDASAEAGIEWVRALCERLQIPRLANYGLTQAHFPELVGKAQRASSMAGNPIELDPAELSAILAAAS